MDHRCLYGHRIPSHFTFAVQHGQCPICGAPTVTVMGYQLARTLAEEVPLDPVKAFTSVRMIESRFTLTEKEATSDDDEPVSEELELSEEELGDDVVIEEPPAEAPAAASPASAADDPAATDAPETESAPAPDEAAAAPRPTGASKDAGAVDKKHPLFTMSPTPDDESEHDFDSVEDEFFTEAPAP